MNAFRRHIPNSCDFRGPNEWVEFENTADLLAIDRVKRWSKDEGFSYYAIRDHSLMAILDDGYEWWVIGYVENPEEINLPEWNHGKYAIQHADGRKECISGDIVSSVCGDKVTLNDGEVTTRIPHKTETR